MNKAPSKRTPSRRWASFLAKYRPDAFPKEPRTVKTRLRGKISLPCIQNELVLAKYALHVFKMPRRMPFGNTPREYLAIKRPFCRPNPLNHAWRADLATPPSGTPAGQISTCSATPTGRILPPPGGGATPTERILPHSGGGRLPLGDSCRTRWLLSRESCHPPRGGERLPLDESRRAHQPLPGESCHARWLPLGESCRAIAHVAKTSPRFAVNDSMVILGSPHAERDAVPCARKRSSRTPGKKRRSATLADKWQQFPPDQTRNAERRAEASGASQRSRTEL